MVNQRVARDFLTSRRERLTPERSGLPRVGDTRRVPGLRRSEVARLADISVEYYTRMERGNLAGVSAAVLDAVARALQLDGSERTHLFDLARATLPPREPVPSTAVTTQLTPSLSRMLHQIVSPALIRTASMDVLAANAAARSLYTNDLAGDSRPFNLTRYCFLDPAARDLYADWDAYADANVALLRSELGRHPTDPHLADLVAEVDAASADFRVRWAANDVQLHRSGTTRFVHPGVGLLVLDFNALELPDHPGLTLKVYTAAPDTGTDERLSEGRREAQADPRFARTV